MPDRVALPLAARTEFGFARTACACPSCSVNCRYIPGFLVPADLRRLLPAGAVLALDDDDAEAALAWAEAHLLASPGFVVARVDAASGARETFRVPTLVPARVPGGTACHWLGADGGCGVHAASPYGCAFFDSHTADAEATRRSAAGMNAVLREWGVAADGGRSPYAVVWGHLHHTGRVAPGPDASRAAMRREIGGDYPQTTPHPTGRQP